ncbi:MAG: phytanoyl-CoA dioxygenase family protein [Pirellulales bacterium]|nr:phytanoyl-CoA dioxygenase family protein [Pirellulales bacterium]
MNLHPKVRPLWQRAVILPALVILMAYKALHLPKGILPRALRSIVTHWDYSMFWVLIGSGATRAYIDQPCQFKMPSSFSPKVLVAPEYQLKKEQIRQFCEDGFLGPFDAFSREDMAEFRIQLLSSEHTKSKTYGFCTPRDRHLEMPSLWEHLKHPAITERLAQLLGPDLLCWRSQIFFKGPRSPAIQFHQASTFMVEDYLDPAVFPDDRNELFQLTVWLAVDDATPENGCMQFVRGSHDRVRTVKFGGEEGFYNAQFSLEFDRDPSRIVTLPVQSGQFVIFAERCIHGSPPNTTDHYRLALNARIIPTHVPVYTNKEKYRSVYNGGKYVLKNWGVAVLRGEDSHQLSRTADIDQLHSQVAKRGQKAA